MNQQNLSDHILDMIKEGKKATTRPVKCKQPSTEEYVHLKKILQMIQQGEL